MKNSLHHEMILASAGSGKTYALVTRYLRLLVMGVEASRIIALTFTRKAAGEFLQQIFLRLSKAAGSEDHAAELSRDLKTDMHGAEFYLGILQDLSVRIGQLQLGTIDHFFGRVVGAFPYELGLTRPHRVLDDFELDQARRLAMELLLENATEENQRSILQFHKQLTWGSEEKRVYSLFEEKLKESHSLFLESGGPTLWGNPKKIYSRKPWWATETESLEQLAETVLQELDQAGLGKGIQKSLHALALGLAVWQPGKTPASETVLNRLLLERENLAQGCGTVEFYKKDVELPEPLALALYRLLQAYIGEEISRKLLMTQALGKLLEMYDGLYDQSVRETGLLVFEDLPVLLLKALGGEDRTIESADIAYRLDATTDHWLLDEFQDTSRVQWKVLSAFVDEILQDTSGRRSFFYVGDVKQSIYGWRGGDARIFKEILEHYGAGGSGITASSLSTSYRSSQPVLDFVNALFGEQLENSPLPGPVVERWKTDWHDHVVSSRTAELKGFSGWGFTDDEVGLQQSCIDLIKECGPLQRGLSCAILVRTNKEVLALAEALKQADIPASMEGRLHIAMDNVVGTWIRAFLYHMARPDMEFPAAYLEAIPLDESKGSVAQLAGSVRKAIPEEGYTGVVRILLHHLHVLINGSPFLSRRAEQILEAATRFDRSGVLSLEAFIQFLETTSVEETSLKGRVQIMTVHKAKGLDFDMVIVAGFGTRPLLQPQSQPLHAERDGEGSVKWIVEMPKKDVIETDAVLFQAYSESENRDLFEALCLLYVAVTRARYAVYVIADQSHGQGKSLTWNRLLEPVLGKEEVSLGPDSVNWNRMWGDPLWYQSTQGEEKQAKPLCLEAVTGNLPRRKPSLRRAPSPSRESHSLKEGPTPLGSSHGRRFGTLMHDYLATIEWLSFEQPDSLSSSAPEEIRERLASFGKTSLAREVFARPKTPCLLWREKPYALKDRGQLTQGIMDRVIILLDSEGNPQVACIYDFKTDTLDPDKSENEQLEARYALQMERYVRAVEALTGLPPEKITTKLIPV